MPTLASATVLTTVTATVMDPTGQAYAGGSYRITLWMPPGFGPPQANWEGGPFPRVFLGSLDSSGSFTLDIPDNLTITPSGTQWRFTVSPLATAPGTDVLVTVTGATQDISAQINAALSNIEVPIDPAPVARPLARAYQDSEIVGPVPGAIYFNLTDLCIHFYTGVAWRNVCGGGVSPPEPEGPVPYTFAVNSDNMLGQPQPGQIISLFTAFVQTIFPANFSNPNSYGNAITNPSALATFTVMKTTAAGTTSIVGTITCDTTGTWAFQTAGFTLNPGDMMWVTAPNPMDATLSDVALSLVGTRTS